MNHSSPASVAATPPARYAGRQRARFPLLRVCLLTYLVYFFARVDVADPDLWWHMRNAQLFLTTGHLQYADSYSFTAAGARVIPFEWLSEIPFYLAYKLAALPGVFVLVFLLCTAIVLGVFRLSNQEGNDALGAFLATVFGAVLMKVSIGGRTLLFGWLYLVILLLILDEVRRHHLRWLWLVPPLFCIWINSHGSWPMGLVVLGIFIASGLVEGSWGNVSAQRWSGRQLRALLIASGASVLALFANPMGFRLVRYPFQVMFGGGSSSGPALVQEFASVNFHTPLGKLAMVLILGTVAVAIFSRERWRLDELGFLLLALYFGLTGVRFLFLAGILVPPIFARRMKLPGLGGAGKEQAAAVPTQGRSFQNLVATGIILAAMAYLFVVSAPRHGKLQNLMQYPDGAVAYMKVHGIRGRLFQDWDWGGYLIWHFPQEKVFIDGRGDPYGANGVFADYWKAIHGRNSEAVLDKYRIQYVLMPPKSSLSALLGKSSRWKPIYHDDVSALFQRTAATPAAR